MSGLERRVQILLAPEQYDQVEREAKRTGQSVAAAIREAITDWLDSGATARAAAARRVLAWPTDAGAGEDWPDMKTAWERDLQARLP